MFYNMTIMRRRLRKAYKAESLVVGQTGDEWLEVGASTFIVTQKTDKTPKEFKAALIGLVNDLPLPGEQYRASKAGNQMQIDAGGMHLQEAYKDSPALLSARMTNVLIENGGSLLRMFLSEDKAILVGEELAQLADPGALDPGEPEIKGPYLTPQGSILWTNYATWLEVGRVSMAGTDMQSDDPLDEWIREAHAAAAAFGAALI